MDTYSCEPTAGNSLVISSVLRELDKDSEHYKRLDEIMEERVGTREAIQEFFEYCNKHEELLELLRKGIEKVIKASGGTV